MFQAAVRAAVRPVTKATRSAIKPATTTSKTAIRGFSTTRIHLSDGPAAPALYGVGAPVGQMPTDEEQATGLERLELLGEMQGINVFDEEPLDSSRLGTLENPVKVFSLDTQRIIGCTGSPADSHDLHWFTLTEEKNRRCPECGSVYALDFQGDHELLAHSAH
jgi:cytochrome c oxidase subunit 5b